MEDGANGNRARNANQVGPVGRNVAANIRRLRQGQGLSIRQLSELLTARPIVVSALNKIELGQRHVNVDDLAAIAAVLQVEPAVLLSDAPACKQCDNEPPAGFRCRLCGAEG